MYTFYNASIYVIPTYLPKYVHISKYLILYRAFALTIMTSSYIGKRKKSDRLDIRLRQTTPSSPPFKKDLTLNIIPLLQVNLPSYVRQVSRETTYLHTSDSICNHPPKDYKRINND